MNRDQEILELTELMNRDVDVKAIVNTVLLAEDMDLAQLADDKPDLFDAVYDSAFELVAQIEQDSR